MLKFRFARKPECLIINKRIPMNDHPVERYNTVIAYDVIYSLVFLDQLRSMTSEGCLGQCHLVNVPMRNYRSAIEAIPHVLMLYILVGGNMSYRNWTIWRRVGGKGKLSYQIVCRLRNGQRIYQWFGGAERAVKRRQEYVFAGGYLSTPYPTQMPQYFKLLKSVIHHPKVIRLYNW